MGLGFSSEGVIVDSEKFMYIINKMSEFNENIQLSKLEKALINIKDVTPIIRTLNELKPTYLPYILEEYIHVSIINSSDALDYSKGSSCIGIKPNSSISISKEGQKYINNKIKGIDEDFANYADKKINELFPSDNLILNLENVFDLKNCKDDEPENYGTVFRSIEDE
ncbi:MAG: hypothetical protein PHN56_01845 [Candidatus Nanoarchaeia archaeon]|nr:hypothetical protein [Candidatus Nanoarchaeia archaeon]